MEPISRSTVQLIVELLNSGYYFPCGVIFLFSVVSPGIKLLVILYGEIVGNIFRILVDDMSKIVDLRKALRVIAKYQCVDVFVSIITRVLVDSDFVTCRLEKGFYFFSFYSLVSILAAQVSDTIPPNSSSSSTASFPHSISRAQTMSSLDMFLLLSSVSMFVFGITWSLLFPILSLKFMFQSKIVVGESVSSLENFVNFSAENVFPSCLVLITCILVPCVAVLVSVLIETLSSKRSVDNKFLIPLSKSLQILSDWCLIEVFAVSLLTSLFLFASFGLLRASAPWGFYAVLMAAMSAFEILKKSHPHTPPISSNYAPVSHTPGEEGETEMKEFRLNSSDEEGEDEDVPSSPVVVVPRGGLVYVLMTITRKLGLPFFLLKALGWVVFFAVWFMNSGSGSVDLNSLSSTMRSNIPLVSKALKSSIPYAIGMCSDLELVKIYNNTSSASNCIYKEYLHYEKNTAYEVLARWLSGFDKIRILDMYVSVPENKKLALTVKGQFDQIQLSLFIGQCLGNIFDSDSSDKKNSQIPICSKIFDKIHNWESVKWSVQVTADCATSSPFVRNIFVDEVSLESEMTIKEEIGFGVSIPVKDLSDHFKQGIKESLQPFIASADPWIPWGPNQYDISTLLSILIKLNIDSTSGADYFSCPSKS